MILFIVLIFIVVGCVIGYKLVENSYGGWDCFFAVVGVVAAIALLVAIFAVVCNPIDVRANIAKFESVKQTLKNNALTEIERATLMNKLIEMNGEIAEIKSYNKSIWDIFIPDEIESVKLIGEK